MKCYSKQSVDKFKTKDLELNEQELMVIWNSLPKEVSNSLWDLIERTISKFGKE